jgi:hypothetical protein
MDCHEVLNDVGSGLARCERNDAYVTAPPTDLRSADDRRFGVIAALRANVRPQRVHEVDGSVALEEHDAVHHLERREDICALRLIANGPFGPFNRFTERRCSSRR